jgi:serine/threonine protein kinase
VWLRGRRFTVGPLGAPAPGLPAQPGTTPEPAASPLASTPSPAYGTPFTTAYGTPSSPAYGTPPTPAYGTPFPGHATPSPAYGTPPTPAYGTPLPAYATPSPSFATPSPVSGTMPLPAASQPGDPGRMDRYEIVRLLDAGGSAEVYLARVAGEPGFEKLVALKVLQSALAREPEVVERFLEEARLASRLDHPNIVQVLDVGRSRDQYFIAMEYVDGADLDRLRSISRRAGKLIPVSVVLAILRRICDGLHAAHGASAADGTPLGLIHRDVKSANVMVGRSGVVKIGDFGIAQASRALDRRRTDVGGKVKGTVGYMAPEQRQGHMLDSRTDIFGVGAIAYELLSGAALDLDPLALGPQGWPHLRRPSTLRRDMPLELDEVVMRALAYDREQRWPSCAVLESSLERIATWHPPIATDKTVGAWARELLALSL